MVIVLENGVETRDPELLRLVENQAYCLYLINTLPDLPRDSCNVSCCSRDGVRHELTLQFIPDEEEANIDDRF